MKVAQEERLANWHLLQESAVVIKVSKENWTQARDQNEYYSKLMKNIQKDMDMKEFDKFVKDSFALNTKESKIIMLNLNYGNRNNNIYSILWILDYQICKKTNDRSAWEKN